MARPARRKRSEQREQHTKGCRLKLKAAEEERRTGGEGRGEAGGAESIGR